MGFLSIVFELVWLGCFLNGKWFKWLIIKDYVYVEKVLKFVEMWDYWYKCIGELLGG